MNRIPVVSPTGEFGTIDQSESHLIGHGGYRLQTPEEIRQKEAKDKYGEGFANEAKAAAAGAARGATFGLSGQLLTKSGVVSPETLQGLEEQNPTASTVGEVAGVVVPGLLTGGASAEPSVAKTIAGAVASPVKAVTELGKSAESIISPLAEKAASKIAGREVSPFLNKAIQSGIEKGAGSAVEGAVYGLGQSVSEEALGDPDLNAEKVLSNIGINALVGGTFGSAFGVGEGALAKAKDLMPSGTDLFGKPKASGPISKSVTNTTETVEKREGTTFSDAVNDSNFSKDERAGIFDGLKEKKENAGSIASAANELGVPTFIPQVSASEAVNKTHEILANSMSHYGVAERQSINDAFSDVSKQVGGILERPGTGSLAETGDKLSESLVKRFENEGQPIKALYDELQTYGKHVPVTPRSTNSIAANVRRIIKEEGLVPGLPATTFIENVANGLSNITNLNELKTFRTNLSKQAPIEAKWVAGLIKDKLDTLETNAIKRFAGTMKTDGAKDRILSLIDTADQAKSSYRKLYSRMEEFGDVLGKRKIHGPQDFIDFLTEGNNSEKFAEKLYQKKNSKFTEFFKKNFPEEWSTLADYQKNKLLQSVTKDGAVNLRQATKKIFSLEPEMQKALFTTEELSKLKAAQTWVDAFPARFNSSGTAHMEGAIQFLDSPLKASIQTARDYMIKSGFDHLGLSGEQAQKVGILSKMERIASQITTTIKTETKEIFDQRSDKKGFGFSNSLESAGSAIKAGTRAAFDFSKKASQAVASAPVVYASDEHNKSFKDVSDLLENPDKLHNLLEGSTQWIYNAAPNTAASIQMASVRAISFLGSKFPKNKNRKALSPRYVPSPAEMSKFNRYYKTVKRPTSVLKSIKTGSLTMEQMETMHSVYPSLLASMQSSVMDVLSDKMVTGEAQKLPYSVKMSVSMFLGQELVSSLEHKNIASMQLTLQGNGKEQARNDLDQSVKVSQAGLSNLGKSQSIMTPLQSVINRADS